LIISELEMKDAGKYTAKLGDLESHADLSVASESITLDQRFSNRVSRPSSKCSSEQLQIHLTPFAQLMLTSSQGA